MSDLVFFKKKPQHRSPGRDWVPYMKKALELAHEAKEQQEVPVGALIVDAQGNVVASAYNTKEKTCNPMAHAECLAIREACQKAESWRLWNMTLVVSLEPCLMCAGAISAAKIDRVVFGAWDNRQGAFGSKLSLHKDPDLCHDIEVKAGVMGDQCRELLQGFFKNRREKKA